MYTQSTLLKMSDFTILFPKDEAVVLQRAYDAITQLNLWEWLRDFTPHPNEGFLLTAHPNLDLISEALKDDGHSGGSFATMMRVMELIAKTGGWDAYLEMHKKRWPSNRPVCWCRSKQGMKIGWCSVASGGVPGCEV